MSFDMPFYETDNRQSKGQVMVEQGQEAAVAAMLGEWKEDNFDIDSLLTNKQEHHGNQYQADHQVPTFNSSANRPNALDLTRPVKFEPGSCQQMKANNPPVSPHHSPYHSADSNTPYTYGNTSPSTSNSRQTTPTSPYTQALHSPVSPHHGGPISPYGQPSQAPPLSPHQSCSRSSSVSPVPYAMPAVFGRYANESSMDSFTFESNYGFKRQHSPIDKNSDMYRAKRERNNIAVRRSREKKKAREAENETRVQELTDENNKLQVKLDTVLKEMKLLKSLYKNIGVALPVEAQQKIEKELSKLCS